MKGLRLLEILALFLPALSSTQEFTCKERMLCQTNEYCHMKEVDCSSEPCRVAIPMCLSSSVTCQGSMPFIDSSGSLQSCSSSAECSTGFECKKDYCCDMTPTGISDVDAVKGININSNVLPPIFVNDLYGSSENLGPTEAPCKPCDIEMCLVATCPNHMNASCVQGNCSCEAWFEDAEAKRVDDCFPVDGQSPSFDMGSITSTLDPIVPHITFHEPLVTMESTNEEVKDYSWMYALGSVGALVLLCLVAFALYKVLDARQKYEKGRNPSRNDEEQKIPLSITASENNNESKATKCQIIGHGSGNFTTTVEV